MTDESVLLHIGDGVALSAVIAYWFSLLGPIATLFSVIWLGIRIYESETVQKWLGKNKIHINRGDDEI